MEEFHDMSLCFSSLFTNCSSFFLNIYVICMRFRKAPSTAGSVLGTFQHRYRDYNLVRWYRKVPQLKTRGYKRWSQMIKRIKFDLLALEPLSARLFFLH